MPRFIMPRSIDLLLFLVFENFGVDLQKLILVYKKAMFSEENKTGNEAVRLEAIVFLTSRLSNEQIGMLRRVNKEVSRVFE